MAEEVIKTTSCCNDAMMGGLLGAMANRDSNPLAMAAMMRNRDDDDMWNNPFAYMMMMGMMRYMYGADWFQSTHPRGVRPHILQNTEY